MPHRRLGYTDRIRERGFRLTPQREMILDAVCEGGGHTTFEEIYRRVQAKAPSINRTTVYRTLDFLRQLRLVVAAEIEGRTVYEIASEEPHHHLICRSCGRVEQVDHEIFEELSHYIDQRYHFRVDFDHMVLPGVCPRCR